VDLTGGELIPEGIISAVVALAGIAALVAMRRVGRIVAGIAMLAVGVITVVHAAAFAIGSHTTSGLDGFVTALVSERAGADIRPSLASGAATTTATAWWLVVLIGGLLVAVGGVIAAARSGSWPAMGGRYEARGGSGVRRRITAESDWDLLDRGLDPTAGPQDRP